MACCGRSDSKATTYEVTFSNGERKTYLTSYEARAAAQRDPAGSATIRTVTAT